MGRFVYRRRGGGRGAGGGGSGRGEAARGREDGGLEKVAAYGVGWAGGAGGRRAAGIKGASEPDKC